jgi:hypothetical protein
MKGINAPSSGYVTGTALDIYPGGYIRGIFEIREFFGKVDGLA